MKKKESRTLIDLFRIKLAERIIELGFNSMPKGRQKDLMNELLTDYYKRSIIMLLKERGVDVSFKKFRTDPVLLRV